MAELQLTRPRPRARLLPPAAASWPGRLAGRFLDWEDWLTLGLGLGALLSVSLSLEEGGWSRDMPALSLVGVLALLAGLVLARSPLWALLAWPLAAVAGATVTFWQTLEMVGPGNLEERVDAIYFRFQTWFHLAFTGGISNDPLPFNVMVVGLTWLGVFLFGWSLYRWHNAWLGLIPGGAALVLDMLFVGDSLPAAIFFYALFGFLLVMRTNLMARMRQWRAEGVRYPPLISLSFLHYTVWAVLVLMMMAWIAPTGPFPTPKPMDALGQQFEGLGVHLVRLAGPLHVQKIIPIHNYTAALPFQGAINLGERELLLVTVEGQPLNGPVMLRGAVYDEYASGGWTAGSRQEVELPSAVEGQIRERLGDGSLQGLLVSLTVEVKAKSVVGTVLFSPGQPVSTNVEWHIDVPTGSLQRFPVRIPGGGANLTDEEVLLGWLPDYAIGVSVERDRARRVLSVQAVDGRDLTLPDAVVARPQQQLGKGQSYQMLGLIQTASPDELRQAGQAYPSWVRNQYLPLPSSLPNRVRQLARDIAEGEATSYDRAKAIESYLRTFPVAYKIADTPPGKDAVDYFLFDSKRGYFNYHASAMVVLLRAVGVPARLAAGFIVDQADQDRGSGTYMVRDQNAYAWAEVYFPGHGWVPFNPSPDRPADLITGEQSDDVSAALQNPQVFPPDVPFDADMPFSTDLSGIVDSGGLASSGGSGFSLGYAPWIALAAGAFAAALAGSVALGWRRSVADLPYPQQLWEKTVRLASWAGQALQPGQTPTEFAARLGRALPGIPDIPGLANAYNRSRFGGREPDGAERQRLHRLWPHLRGALLGALFTRMWRRR